MNGSDSEFLQRTIELLVRLRDATVQHNRPMLASLIELARTEAEDELRTDALAAQRFCEFKLAGAAALIGADLDREIAEAIRADDRAAACYG